MRFCFLAAFRSYFDNVEKACGVEEGAADEGERRESFSGEPSIPTMSVVVSSTEGEDNDDGDDMVIKANDY